MSRVVRKPAFCICKTKTQISFAVTAKLISAIVFAIQIVQSLFYLNPKFQDSSHLLWLYSPVCVGPDWKTQRPVFLQRGSYKLFICSSVMVPTYSHDLHSSWQTVLNQHRHLLVVYYTSLTRRPPNPLWFPFVVVIT